ncbi:hypothetical protein [Teredinibacter turnerae]|uniref:hypothetical protein n=1 Tax=Teredinibacter turnerae TaxID=2426 RepID=UPI000AB42E17|nr:hypothetical protein [Teredinibacter turnerae]
MYRPRRKVNRNNSNSYDEEQLTAVRSRYNTRFKKKVQREIEKENEDSAPTYPQPAKPSELFCELRDGRPKFQNGIWNSLGGRASARCARCGEPAETIDHKIDWKTYILNKCDIARVDVEGGYWEGYRREDVAEVYNDPMNLQPMCVACNSSKNGPKHYDRIEPRFFDPVRG